MKNPQEKPILVQGPEESHVVDEDEVWGARGCGSCFNLPCFQRRRRYDHVDESSDTLLHEERTGNWWSCKLNKLKQLSEKVAGPKWKNFIRKMGGYCHKRKCQKNRFQYDPQSYALNFDDDDDDDSPQGFPSRFVAPFEDDRQRARSGM